MAHQEAQSRVPVLVAPRAETVVDGRSVTFEWNPAPQARRYRLEISETPDFEHPIYEAATDSTQHVVENAFALDEATYYWRIIAIDANGGMHGQDNVESFISASPEQLDLVSPDEEEDMGPAARLFRGAATQAAAEATQHPRYVEEAAEIGVQHEGIEAGQILGFILATVVALGLTIFALIGYVDIATQTVRAAAAGASGYPERTQLELQGTRALTQYGVVDAEQGIYRIPIDRAIELMANEARERSAGDYSSEVNLLPLDQ